MIRVSQCDARPISGAPISGSPSHAANASSSAQPKNLPAVSSARPLRKYHTSSDSPSRSVTGISEISPLRAPAPSRAFEKEWDEKPSAWMSSCTIRLRYMARLCSTVEPTDPSLDTD